MERLFQHSLYAVFEQRKSIAVQEVENLDRSILRDPSLGGALQKITTKHELDVARFQGENTAKRRIEERDTSDGFGDHHRIKMPWYDVSIPFVGDADSFRIAPSRCSIPNCHARIGQNELMISVPDDAGTDAVVESFKSIVNGNLQTLKFEMQQMKPQLEQAIQQAADHRRAELDAQDTRDKSRSFRVIN
jgi:hypothetical protein